MGDVPPRLAISEDTAKRRRQDCEEAAGLREVYTADVQNTVQAEDWHWERTGEGVWEPRSFEVAEDSSDEDEDGHVKPQLGDGVWGRGPPLTARMFGKRVPFCDGFGLCSLGRWCPSRRRCAEDTPSLGFAESLGKELLKILVRRVDLVSLAAKLSLGKVSDNPFSSEVLAEGRELLFTALEYAGAKLPVRERTEGQPFYLAAMEELLRISGDPDSRVFFSSSVSFAKGVRLGPGVCLPRVPSVFEKKEKWRKYDSGFCEPGAERENYLSAREHAGEVQQQFQAEAALGAMVEVTTAEARAQFGKQLAVASLGALEKKDGTYRVVHGGANGITVNSAIRVRDQIRSPGAGELRAALQELPGQCFGLTGDVERAHRLVKIAAADWGLQACKTGVGGSDKLWLNKVGTFLISSAAYHWSRLMSGLGRAAFYLLGKREIFMLVYVDDLLWLAHNDKDSVQMVCLVIFFFVLLGLPFSWRKFKGGGEFCWVGLELNLRESKLGLSVQRAQWLIQWLTKTTAADCVKIADVSAVLGRLSFALTALGHLRPFLGPVYAWVASLDHRHAYKVPRAISLIFKFLAKALGGGGRLTSAGKAHAVEKELFRTDAKAEGNEVWIAGWALDCENTKQCRWFSERLDHVTAPWVYMAGEAYRQIASLELLATLAAVMLFGVPPGEACGFHCSAATDNRGNSNLVSRLLTTKFPLCILLMELAAQLQDRGAELRLHWLPRLQNEEAGDYSRFDKRLRLRFDLRSFQGLVLQDLRNGPL